MKKTDIKQIAKNKFFIALAAGILIGLIVTIAVFFKDSGRYAATSSVSFLFDGAADGRTPDGEEFDIRMLGDDEILKTAMAACNMDKYTPEQLRSSLYIRGDYPEDIAGQILSFESLFDSASSKPFTHDGFHASRYTIALYNDFDRKVSKTQLNTLLSAVMASYREHFRQQYGKTWKADLMELDLDRYDYIQQLTILKDRMDEAVGMADEMYQKEPGIITGGEGFNDICIRMRNISENEIPRLQAMVVMGGLSKNYERLLIQYEYEIEDLSIELKNQTTRLEEVENLLNSYKKNDVLYISAGEELTKIDGNSSETYDILVAERREVADGITEIKSGISDRMMRMQDLVGDDASYAEYFEKVYAVLLEQVGEEQYEQLVDENAMEIPDAEAADGEATEENPEDTEKPEAGEDGDTEENTEAMLKDTETAPKEYTEASIRKGRGDVSAELSIVEDEIKALEDKIIVIENDFSAMLTAYNEMQLNEATIEITPTLISSKKLISGAFIKTGIKCAGPFISISIMACIVMVLLDRKKKNKA